MLTQSDLQAIDHILDKRLKKELLPIKTDVAVLKTDVAFTKDAVINLLDESQDIHETLVKEKLPQRVHRLEHIVHATA